MVPETKCPAKRSLFFWMAAAMILLTFQACRLGNWVGENKSVLTSDAATNGPSLSLQDVADALKEALQIGANKVIDQVGQTNGFTKDSAIHIPLPEQLGAVKKALSAVGMTGALDTLEARLNTAAEVAAPKARAVFLEAIADMTFDDVKSIYNGANDAATQYFKNKMTPALIREMAPVVSDSLSEVGAIQIYDQIMGRYGALPLVPDIKADLSDYVVEKGMEGIFYYLAKEEAAIRENPARRTTELLRRVFGAQ